MQSLYLSLARRDPAPLIRSLRQRPAIAPESQWANFVRNHDELTLDKLTENQRNEVFEAFAPDEAQRIYGRGITRRVPPMLEGDPRRVRMVYSLLFSLPGTPVLFYGEEIGMGENTEIPGRASVRTPMQWDATPTGGFSSARPSRLIARPPSDGYAPEHVNVVAQRDDEDSLLQHVQRLIARYRASAEIGWGEFEVLEHDEKSVLVHSMRSDLGRFVALHNFAERPTTVQVRLEDEPEGALLVDLLGPGGMSLEGGAATIELGAYGYRWFRVSRPGDGRLG
jgi:glycosidase